MAEDRSKLPLDTIVDGLRDLVERHSSRAEISRRLGKAENWLSRVLLGELRLDLNRVEKVLQEIDVPLGWFLSWQFEQEPTPSPSKILGILVDSRPSPAEFFAKHARQLDEALERGTRLEQQELIDTPDRLKDLEELRFRDRDEAKFQAEALLLHLIEDGPQMSPCAVAEISRLLGIWASIQRVSERKGDASAALCWSLDASERLRLQVTSALTRQRAAYLLRDAGEPLQAKRMLDSALLDFAQQGRFDDVARCLVDRASLELQMQDSEKARADASAALQLLRDEDWRNISIAHQVLAEILIFEGGLEEALHHLDSAHSLYEDRRDDLLLGHLLWSRGRLQAQLANFGPAADDYRNALDRFAGNGMPADVAVVSLELARSLLTLGRHSELESLADQVQALTPLLRGSPIADHVLMEFVRVVRYGRLSVAFVSRCLERIKSGGSEDPP